MGAVHTSNVRTWLNWAPILGAKIKARRKCTGDVTFLHHSGTHLGGPTHCQNYVYIYISVLCFFRAFLALTDLKNGSAAVELAHRVSGACVLPISSLETLEHVCYLSIHTCICPSLHRESHTMAGTYNYVPELRAYSTAFYRLERCHDTMAGMQDYVPSLRAYSIVASVRQRRCG